MEGDLAAVAYGNGRFVAGGQQTVVSVNGTDWSKAALPTTGTVSSVIFAAGKFTAADDQGKTYDSTDGVTWTVAKTYGRLFEPAPKFVSLTYADGLYVLSNADGRKFTYGTREWDSGQGWGTTCSRTLYLGGQFLTLCEELVATGTPDGRAWTRRDSQTYALLRDAVHDGRRYLAVGEGGTIITSPDGVNWAVQTKPGQAPDYYAVEYANGLYVLAGDGGYIWTSRDGTAWGLRYSGLQVDLASVAGAEGLWVAVGADGAVLSSPDPWPFKWARRASGVQQPLRAVAAGKGQFVAVGAGGTSITSTDGKAWRSRSTGTDGDLQTVIFTGTRFVAGGKSTAGKGLILTSVDGANWTVNQTNLPAIRGLAHGADQLVAVGADGLVATSPDGNAWTRVSSLTQRDLHAVTFGAGRFLAVGDGVAVTSTDGTVWTKAEGVGREQLYGVTYGAGRFFLAGEQGTAGYSQDGTSLKLTLDSIIGNMRGIALQGDRLIAVGQHGAIRLWQLPSATRSTVQAAAEKVRVGEDLSITVTLMDEKGSTFGDKQVTLLQEPVLVEPAPAQVKTSYRGEALFQVRASKSGTVTLAFLTDDGTRLVHTATIVIRPECGQRFSDVSGTHPACKAIEQLAEQGVINGFPDGFRPDRGLTRAELATMLVRALKLQPTPGRALPFTDVQGHWAARDGYLQAAVAAKAFSGMPDGSFQPDDPVTRAQLVKVVAAAAQLRAAGQPPYTDISSADWYAGWVAAASQAQMLGRDSVHPVYADAQFKGEQPATRAEAAAMLANLLGHQ